MVRAPRKCKKVDSSVHRGGRMICIIRHEWQTQEPDWHFLDVGRHGEELGRTLVTFVNDDDGEAPFAVFVGSMPKISLVDGAPTPWTEIVGAKAFFDFWKRGGERLTPFSNDRKPRTYNEIEPLDHRFDMFTQEQLEELLAVFQHDLASQDLTFLEDDEEVVFGPLFETEVAARR